MNTDIDEAIDRVRDELESAMQTEAIVVAEHLESIQEAIKEARGN